MADPLLTDDWHPVASTRELCVRAPLATRLLGTDLVLWRAADGRPRAWLDRCPHRGTRLSIGSVARNELVCAYHGWHFAPDGRCSAVPALPGFVPPANARVKTFDAVESHGLVWVCLGTAKEGPPAFPEASDPGLKSVICGPYEVVSSGPRVVENFLDLAHFAYVHTGVLGDPQRPEVRDYTVRETPEGPVASGCFAWQPKSNTRSAEGSQVEYGYRVTRPLTAVLTKLPQKQGGFREAIALHVQPVEEEASRAWIVMAMSNEGQSDDELRAFQDAIFAQDRPILENQVPRRLPLAPDAEMPVASDRMSQAYRRYLARQNLRYGVVR